MANNRALFIFNIGYVADYVHRELGLTYEERNEFLIHWVAYQLYEYGYFEVQLLPNRKHIHKGFIRKNPLYDLAHQQFSREVERWFYTYITRRILDFRLNEFAALQINVVGASLYVNVK